MPAHATDPNDRGGVVLALTAAAGLGLAIALSRYAYQGGTNGLTVATIRASLLAPGLLAVCLLTRRRLTVPLPVLLNAIGLGMLMSVMFYANVGAVEFIPIGLTALLFYTYPPIVGLLQAVVDRALPHPVKITTLAAAFLGLALMLGDSFGSSDPRGVGLAMAAAVATAWNAIWIVRRVAHVDALVLTFYMASIAAAMLLAFTLGTDAFVAPDEPQGWGGLLAVVTLQCLSVPLYFLAIPRIGAIKSAMLSNVQPLTSILAAYLIFGELLSATQMAGGALVLAAVATMQWHDGRAARAAAVHLANSLPPPRSERP